MSSSVEVVNCPVCYRKYPVTEIESHANKCIFLNSGENDGASTKRREDHDHKETNQAEKRQKREGYIEQNHVGQSHDEIEVPSSSSFRQTFTSPVPLAEQMRPTDLTNYFGQEHVLGLHKVLRTLLEKRDIPSMILWGPPGCGKTTLAHIIANQCKKDNQEARFVTMSATMSGVNDVKDAVKIAKNELRSFKRRTILFMDEIHRFNKLQQDIFLPHVESGTITLIGATTENPSFSLNSALLSRCRVIVLEKLNTQHIIAILERTLIVIDGKIVKAGENINFTKPGDRIPRVLIDEATVIWLAEMCDGDARVALNSLQLALQARDQDSGVILISLDDIKDGVKRSHLLYDRKGDEHYNIISAMHKSIRASDDNAALYWMTRMLQGGEDPLYIARRLVRAASEDIGLADPMALTVAVSAMQGCQLLGMPECDVLLAQCAVYLARAPKSREMDHALALAKECIAEHKGPLPSVPLHLRNAPTRLMKDLGYGKGYNMAHKDISHLTYMPKGLENVDFFGPSESL
ncbi:ATPase WRNIP1 [Cryptotermes secundus]|uniref:ATPase WRNIP1 n=1 Tax=Cryptotermes secundus TaxID=105785 RepID=A0A2J7Q1L6_9NEOP|nr:ATPase WRNIP1 [Cryptotermes secundus]PNF22466.1 ATPase WRNIP1 [Cryptotermes secundus]